MCGRLACGLQSEYVCNSCCYKKPGDHKFTRPQWKNFFNFGKTYKPSYNICPTEVAPVLLCGSHVNSDTKIVAPMIFGLIPPWTEGGEKGSYSTINCRIETVKTSKLYGNLLKQGQRCVVICNGFYEWQKQQGNKRKPYFIHLKQHPNVQVDNPKTWELEFTPEKGFNGFRSLRLAALFDKKISLGESSCSFTIITKEASSEMSWLHFRMPAVIETEEQLEIWLNHQKFDANYALSCLSSRESLVCWPISSSVNRTDNKDIACIKQHFKPDGMDSQNRWGSTSILRQWLENGRKRKTEEAKEVAEKKKK